MTTLNSISSITATPDTALTVACNITDNNGVTKDMVYLYRSNDPYGELTPQITAFLEDNPDYPIAPYVQPALAERRKHAFIERFDFRNGVLALGFTTQKIKDYLASITEPTKQDERLIYWEDSQIFRRLDPFVTEFAAFAGITDAKLDTLFRMGA